MEIVSKIEILRLELNKLCANKRLADQEVIETSQQLDAVLNEYNLLRMQRRVPFLKKA
ncbi:hypothetical protein J2T12_000490 [Paenibacillus anaericanus]|uniref:Aspartyl-phosphate phosphatase Spo0E family protein n=1 Tax=Paenibacillus anaericanus TaxID=170367 RepID=A0A433Y8W5_9BACL|nr:aspartyl-phosphate phosphatase Spo0E family protein [Paenibacillus anaericanus]MDQ0087096.1 hypothetical protein [Paenibacillus anaericanus]RUT46248.1 aspartyl-phosphate phosphatase Spo0E family protein [Paenibacillus anaericanus]